MALSATALITWSRTALAYFIGARPVPRNVVKAGVEAVLVESRASINAASLALQQTAQAGKLAKADVAEWLGSMQQAAKLNYMANAALARGGWDQMRPADWERVSGRLELLYSGGEGKWRSFEKFGQDVLGGRYGADLSSGQFLTHAGMVAEGGRAVYENELKQVHSESGYTECMRVLATVNNCDDCIEWADEWVPIPDSPEIGSSVCGSACHCTQVFR